MTIGGWIVFGIIAAVVVAFAFVMCAEATTSTKGIVLTVSITAAVILVILFGMLWYFKNTASGQRALIDQKSNLNNGLERTIKIYTADGNVIAEYEGQIDIQSDQTYIKFDYEGKRYIYYNCFVETIADIDEE